ncbi:MAG: hypothetical protein CL927_16165 [Deltaproteobacteria bacterium]|nr:hypothetical protein [Deltaproteobacteria bacterium]
MNLNTVGILALAGAAGLAYASVVDRTSVWALSVVEVDSQLPTPLWAILLAVGILALGVGRIRQMAKPSRPAVRGRPVVQRRAAPQAAPGRDGLVQRVRALPLPTGCRILVDDPPTIPLHLVVDEAPEKRVRRAVGALGVLLAGLPLPPRVRVSMRRCPQPNTPWHHVVGAALGEHLPRSEFKVVPGADGVDVMFFRPDSSWRT